MTRLLAWYGDDFTGAAAVLETLAFAGVPSVLFLAPPDAQLVRRFAACRAIGIAGIARAKSPAWMDRELPGVFRALAGFDAAITHYKVCSTFDSAPAIGSIGHAAEIALPILGGRWTPMLVASLAIGRYQAFGNLFARADQTVWRLDRHPTMRRHPVTPMTESDLRIHLAQQTALPIGLVDLAALKGGQSDAALAAQIDAGAAIVSLDAVDAETLEQAGRLVWEHRGERLFAIGSQGLEEALVAWWRRTGLLDAAPSFPPVGAAERIAVVSGSCSPVTAGQIDWAEANGFGLIPLDVAAATDPEHWQRAVQDAVSAARARLADARDPLVFTARGPDDPSLARLNSTVARSGLDADAVHARIGEGLGQILAALHGGGLRRMVIAGGDTSSRAAGSLGIRALTAAAPMQAGAALFHGHGEDGAVQVEIALKGGQMGGPDFFGRIKAGR